MRSLLYERLLTVSMRGDKVLVVRADAVEATWKIVDRILNKATFSWSMRRNLGTV
jgi:glucose-6-phosphate 1-dehydrogenase